MVSSELLSLLACPECRAEVAEEGAGLRCLGCGLVYPLVGGVPMMVANGRRAPKSAEAESGPTTPRSVQADVPGRGKPEKSYYADYGYRALTAGAQEIDRPEYPFILEWVTPGSSAIDLGCGEGSLGRLLIERQGCRVAGIDVSAEGVEQARAKGIDARLGDIDLGLDYPDGAFDYALLNVTLQMVYQPAKVLSEALRVGRKAVVSFPNIGYWRARAELLFSGVFPRAPLYGYPWHRTRHIHLFSYRDLCLLLREQGVEILDSVFLKGDSRTPGRLARVRPNLFSALCLVLLEKRERE